MKLLQRFLQHFRSDRRGVTALEYGLVGSVLFGVIYLGFVSMASALSQTFNNVGVSL